MIRTIATTMMMIRIILTRTISIVPNPLNTSSTRLPSDGFYREILRWIHPWTNCVTSRTDLLLSTSLPRRLLRIVVAMDWSSTFLCFQRVQQPRTFRGIIRKCEPWRSGTYHRTQGTLYQMVHPPPGNSELTPCCSHHLPILPLHPPPPRMED